MTRGERYRMRDVQRMLGVSRTVISRLIAGGFVQPERGRGREHLFSFRDVVMLRTAHSLRKAGIPPRKIVRALENLRSTWSPDRDLTSIRISAMGADVAVHDSAGRWAADFGQLLIDFEPVPACVNVARIARLEATPVSNTALDDFHEAAELESDGRLDAAETAYWRAIYADRSFVDAYLNLGCLLCDRGRYDDAVSLYGDAVLAVPGGALLHFNLGVALEDAERLADALDAYRRCIDLQPDFADAHFNSARIHEELGETQHAIRHFNRYRTLNKDP
ncbi:tetratricopeptide repeat protein [Paraburkholderia sp. RL17-337-BIB-A]|uniref:tetratricopeptide repeat protein n=1 Tax=Paraburkholderia sp. RL17-337-BIB-A TaxID=3031636 RepID=UPI0038BA591A